MVLLCVFYFVSTLLRVVILFLTTPRFSPAVLFLTLYFSTSCHSSVRLYFCTIISLSFDSHLVYAILLC
ncbi:hypothetical protein B0H16DRAFT_1635674 [Mycena metata]|uniref:Uncharacterized protein n=1 Tax=Mycena metata TaxID=1033252 RepID=A0AAD7GUZ4_9AGAR|nr:hypothetical protein B0H16DRAFT_1635674 [Mycena metata]